MASILIVDDEPAIRDMLKFTLSGDGHDCIEAADARAAQLAVRDRQPALILLDWMLPGISGVDLARRLKQDPASRDIPIIMLTAKAEETDKVRALDTGADDYITKPFSTQELLARIRAVLRRSASPAEGGEIVEVDRLRIDTRTHRVSVSGRTLELSPTEFRLLHFFATHPERVHTRSQLLDGVWGNEAYVEERTVDVHIRRLRKLLAFEKCDHYIQTVRSVGYRFSTTAS
jgi:two-component system phosphate regulon response regulator PhoB